MKHGLETDLEDLDFEAIDKEIEANEAAQAAQVAATEDPPAVEKEDDAPPSFFFGLLCMF